MIDIEEEIRSLQLDLAGTIEKTLFVKKIIEMVDYFFLFE